MNRTIKGTVEASVKSLAYGLWYGPSNLRQRLKAEREVGVIGNPTLVYQMAKVGSTTVVRSLRAAGIDDVFHVHFLAGNPAKRIRAARRKRDAVPSHFFIEQALKHWIQRPGFRCKVITLVRDPIARNISGLFENYRWMVPEVIGRDGRVDPQLALKYLNDHLKSPGYYNYTFNWFDNELKAVFGIDVFAHPFDKEAGYAHIESENTEVLVLRLENLSELIPTIVSDFVGRELDAVMGRQRGKSDEAYRTVKQNVKIAHAACQTIYSTPFVQHFYSERMIARFIERWSH